jgi:hypothetical protein
MATLLAWGWIVPVTAVKARFPWIQLRISARVAENMRDDARRAGGPNTLANVRGIEKYYQVKPFSRGVEDTLYRLQLSFPHESGWTLGNLHTAAHALTESAAVITRHPALFRQLGDDLIVIPWVDDQGPGGAKTIDDRPTPSPGGNVGRHTDEPSGPQLTLTDGGLTRRDVAA